MKKGRFDIFIAKARAIHGNKYDYSKVVYVNAKTKVCIICPEHGEFWQTPDSHINQKCGCQVCAENARIIKRIERARDNRSNLQVETPPGSKAVPVGTKGDYALVDEEDYERVMQYNWYFNCGYARNDTVGMMHRFIMNPPDNMEVDHKFHNKLDNRKGQLRICTRVENSRNTRRKTKISKYKGVYKQPLSKSWFSMIKADGGIKYLGTHPTEEEAARAYDKAAKEIQGDFAWLNFPNE